MAFGQPVNQPLHGVNLGGWLVLERWITPSLFTGSDAVDEYTFCATAAGRRKLAQHHKTFITEADFAWLAEHGIDAVRLPVGYWLFGDEPPFIGSRQYVDKAFVWAAKYGLKILLDLHGAPGSQNGNDHSGQVGEIGWHHDLANVAKTLTVLKRLAERYGKQPALLGVSLLNEPSHTIPQDLLIDFYENATMAIRQHCPSGAWIIFSDSFRPKQWYHRLPNLVVDHHHYQLFGDQDKRRSLAGQLRYAHWLLPFKIWRMARHHQLVIGEWSLALPGQVSNAQTVAYARAQLQAFKPAKAWFFWTYKTETSLAWSYRDCVQRGWV